MIAIAFAGGFAVVGAMLFFFGRKPESEYFYGESRSVLRGFAITFSALAVILALIGVGLLTETLGV